MPQCSKFLPASGVGATARHSPGIAGALHEVLCTLRGEAGDWAMVAALRAEAFQKLVKGELPLLVTVHKANDILTAIRLAKEFNLKLVLDGAAEAPEVLAQIKASGYPVIL